MSLLRFCLSADPLIRLSVQYICQHKKGSLAAVLRAVYALSLIYASDRSLCPLIYASDNGLCPTSDLRPLFVSKPTTISKIEKSASLLSASQRSSCLQNVQEDTFCVSLDLLNNLNQACRIYYKFTANEILDTQPYWGWGGGESFDCF